MKKTLLLFALVLGLMPTLFAQEAGAATASEEKTETTASKYTADEIINNYIEAIGGAEAWKAFKNMRSEGKMAMQGQEFPFVVVMGAPNLMRLDVDIMADKMTQSFDGKTAWQIVPFMGINKPTEMSEIEAKDINQNELVPEFIDYAARGYTVELVDTREVEGIQTQGIRLTDGKDKDLTYYFDLENFVPIMTEGVAKYGQFKGATIQQVYSDYQEAEGVILPFFTEIRLPIGIRQMILTKIESNVEIAEGFFSMPE